MQSIDYKLHHLLQRDFAVKPADQAAFYRAGQTLGEWIY